MLLYILAASVAGGVLSVLLAALILRVDDRRLAPAMPRLLAYSTGTLLGSALLGMLPHAAESLTPHSLFMALLVSLLGFYVLERLFVWRHCHKEHCDVHAASGPLLLLGDAVHNFVDGVVIAGAFLTAPALGVATTVATIAHEVPQELGEFVVYLRHGYSRRRAIVLNVLTSLTTVAGALIGYVFLSDMRAVTPTLLAVAAGSFIYVALADLVPTQRGKAPFHLVILDLGLVAAGILTIATLAHHSH